MNSEFWMIGFWSLVLTGFGVCVGVFIAQCVVSERRLVIWLIRRNRGCIQSVLSDLRQVCELNAQAWEDKRISRTDDHLYYANIWRGAEVSMRDCTRDLGTNISESKDRGRTFIL